MARRTEQVVAALRRESEATEGLVAAYLFGSAARGDESARDVDVALLWAESVPPRERWRRGEALATRLELALRLRVDLVDLGQAGASLQHRVLSQGVRAFESDPVARVRFEAVTLSMAIDFLEWRKPYLERWLSRVARGR